LLPLLSTFISPSNICNIHLKTNLRQSRGTQILTVLTL
jgi:hypothetical protein